MNHETICAQCALQPGAEATSPFGPDSVVYKVGGKIFAIVSLDAPRLNLKVDPELAVVMRERHSAVEPAWHMNKRHWNSVYWERDALSPQLVGRWIRHSYDLVVAKLPVGVRSSLVNDLPS